MSDTRGHKSNESRDWDGLIIGALVGGGSKSRKKFYTGGSSSSDDGNSDDSMDKTIDLRPSTEKLKPLITTNDSNNLGKQKSKSDVNLENPSLEKFPDLAPPKSFLSAKQKSMTEAELQAEVISSKGIAAVNERLKNDPSPLSLEEARSRRASIKEENMEVRKRSVEFIRRRTTSRAALTGRPILEMPIEEPRKGKN